MPETKHCNAPAHGLDCKCGFGMRGGESSAEAAFSQRWFDKLQAVKQEWALYKEYVRILDPRLEMTPQRRLELYEEMEAV